MSFSDSAGQSTSVMIYFVLENELKKMTSDVIMTCISITRPHIANYGDFWIQSLKLRLSGYLW